MSSGALDLANGAPDHVRRELYKHALRLSNSWLSGPVRWCTGPRDDNFTRGFGYLTRQVRVRARNLTRGSYPYPIRFYYGSGTVLISYPRVPDRYPKIVILDFQPTSTLASCPHSTAHPTAIPPCQLMLLI
jgi:hypothetical protein